MKYDIEIGSGVMVSIRSFIKVGSGIQMLIGEGTHRHTHTHTHTHKHTQIVYDYFYLIKIRKVS
jgi:hypothetical protein